MKNLILIFIIASLCSCGTTRQATKRPAPARAVAAAKPLTRRAAPKKRDKILLLISAIQAKRTDIPIVALYMTWSRNVHTVILDRMAYRYDTPETAFDIAWRLVDRGPMFRELNRTKWTTKEINTLMYHLKDAVLSVTREHTHADLEKYRQQNPMPLKKLKKLDDI